MSQPKHDATGRNTAVRPTITWASEWARIAPVTRIVHCPDCGGLRYAGEGPHAPRWLDGRRVDCVGRIVDAAGGAR